MMPRCEHCGGCLLPDRWDDWLTCVACGRATGQPEPEPMPPGRKKGGVSGPHLKKTGRFQSLEAVERQLALFGGLDA